MNTTLGLAKKVLSTDCSIPHLQEEELSFSLVFLATSGGYINLICIVHHVLQYIAIQLSKRRHVTAMSSSSAPSWC